jgi:enoyl-CoA hydratase/carnithine racemase
MQPSHRKLGLSLVRAAASQRRWRARPFSATASEDDNNNNDGPQQQQQQQQRRVQIKSLDGGIRHVVLSRPAKMNALDLPMFESIAGAAAELRADPSVRAVILSGEGRAFCTGLDVVAVAHPLRGGGDDGGGIGIGSVQNPLKNVQRLLERPSGYAGGGGIGNLAQDVGYLWRDLPVPVLACLHGMCYGGGMQIALGADLRFATPDCRLSILEARWGLIPDMSASVTLRELVRMDVAKELTMTGRIISGEEAAELGLVTRCVDDPMAEATKVAGEIVARSPDSVAAAKRLYQETWVAPEEDCLREETALQRQLLASYNQLAAAGRNFGVKLPYANRRDGIGDGKRPGSSSETHPF